MFRRFIFFLILIIFSIVFSVNVWAVNLKISDDSYIDLRAQARIFYLNKDEEKDVDYRKNEFQIYKFRLAAAGQVSKWVQFYAMVDANENEDYQVKLWEAAGQITIIPELIIKAGKIRVPFSRHNFIARHQSPVMSSDGDYFLPSQFKDALKAVDPFVGGYRSTQPFKRTDFGAVIAGDIKEGMFRYYLGIFQEDRSVDNKLWKLSGGFDKVTAGSQKDKSNLEYDARIEFTPIMLGFKPEETAKDPSLRTRQTYLGKMDTMTFGIGYHHEKHLNGVDAYGDSSLSRDGIAVDFSVEKKYGELIPGLEIGYIYLDDNYFYQSSMDHYKKGDSKTWYLDTHLIYDKKIGFGIPGIGFRYEHVQNDGIFNNKEDLAYSRYGACISYYFKGSANRIGIGFDYVKAEDALQEYIKHKGWEDSTLVFYTGLYIEL